MSFFSGVSGAFGGLGSFLGFPPLPSLPSKEDVVKYGALAGGIAITGYASAHGLRVYLSEVATHAAKNQSLD